MTKDSLKIVVAIGLVVYGLYIGAYVPGLLAGSPATIIVIGFLAQTIAALVAAAGVLWRQSWAPVVIVVLGVAIAVTYLFEGFGLGLISYNHALGAALLGLAVTIVTAIYVSRRELGPRLRAV